MALNFSTNIRVGVWVDDLRLGIKGGLKALGTLKPEAVGLDAFSSELSPRNLSQSARRDLSHYVRARGALLEALRADLGGRRLADAQHLDANLARLHDAIQLAADMGTPQIVVPGGFVPPEDEKENATTRATMMEAARALAGFAATSGVRICWQAGAEAPDVLARFLNSIDSSGILEVDFNPGAWVMRGINPLKALNDLSSRVGIATAVEHYRGGAEAPFGQGDVRWGEVIVGLSTLQRSRPIDMLAGSALDGERTQTLFRAYKRLVEIRNNPMSA